MTLAEFAQWYASSGYAVFPVQPCDKRPLGRLAPHGLRDATTDATQIERWWRAEPEANVGVVTGRCFDVLDVDGPKGWRSLARLVEAHGCLEIGPTVATPGGGMHYYYRPTGIGNRAGFVPGIDWRGKGGYVLGVGSVHPNGGVYEWAVTPHEMPLRDACPWLVELLGPSAAPIASPPVLRRTVAEPYGRSALEAECARVLSASIGTRNATLNVAAYNLAQLIAAGALQAREVADRLLVVAAQVGLGEREARRTIASAFRAGATQPRRVPL